MRPISCLLGMHDMIETDKLNAPGGEIKLAVCVWCSEERATWDTKRISVPYARHLLTMERLRRLAMGDEGDHA